MASDKDNIKAALDKVEADSQKKLLEKAKINERIDRIIPKIKAESRDEKETEKCRTFYDEKKTEYKDKLIFRISLFIILVISVSAISRETRTTLIEYGIILMCSAGIALSKMKKK